MDAEAADEYLIVSGRFKRILSETFSLKSMKDEAGGFVEAVAKWWSHLSPFHIFVGLIPGPALLMLKCPRCLKANFAKSCAICV